MNYTVGEWMREVIAFIDPNASVSEALALMRRRYIDSLIVNKTADNPEYGIVTSIDVSDKIVAQERDPQEIKVREIMSSPLHTVTTTMHLKECARLMKDYHFHHLPVINETGDLVGMISASDFLVAAEAMKRAPGDRII